MNPAQFSSDYILNLTQAVGINPQTNEPVYFDSVSDLHDFIIESYQYLNDHSHNNHIRSSPKIYLCVHSVSLLDGVSINVFLRDVQPNGYVQSILSRENEGMCMPSENYVVLPKNMFDNYLNSYFTRRNP